MTKTKLDNLKKYHLKSIQIENKYNNVVVMLFKNPRSVGFLSVKQEDVDQDLDLSKVHYKLSKEMKDRLNLGSDKNIIFIPKGLLAQNEDPF